MFYTLRLTHLESKPSFFEGDHIVAGQFVGMTGNTGGSDGIHLHIDCVEGVHNVLWHLINMETGKVKSCPKQLNYFIDADLFKSPITITTPYCDYAYQKEYKKLHHAYDVVPTNRKDYGIYWNRSMLGTVLTVDYDAGYGYYILIGFEV